MCKKNWLNCRTSLKQIWLLAAAHQKMMYHKHSTYGHFDVGDMVWLSVPTGGKLDPRGEGNWKISAVKSPVTIEITDGMRKKWFM